MSWCCILSEAVKLCCAIWGVFVASTRFSWKAWGRGEQVEADFRVWFCFLANNGFKNATAVLSVSPSGFSHRYCWVVRQECCFCPLGPLGCWVWVLAWYLSLLLLCQLGLGGSQENGGRHVSMFASLQLAFSLVMVAASQWPHLCAMSLPLSLGSVAICPCYWGLNIASALLALGAILWGLQQLLSCLSFQLRMCFVSDFVCVPCLCLSFILPPLLILMCPPSDILMSGSLRCVCVLNR